MFWQWIGCFDFFLVSLLLNRIKTSQHYLTYLITTAKKIDNLIPVYVFSDDKHWNYNVDLLDSRNEFFSESQQILRFVCKPTIFNYIIYRMCHNQYIIKTIWNITETTEIMSKYSKISLKHYKNIITTFVVF